jgi:hypothetical protein
MRPINSMGIKYSMSKANGVITSVGPPECIVVIIENRSPGSPPVWSVAPSPWRYPYPVIGPVNISYQWP